MWCIPIQPCSIVLLVLRRHHQNDWLARHQIKVMVLNLPTFTWGLESHTHTYTHTVPTICSNKELDDSISVCMNIPPITPYCIYTTETCSQKGGAPDIFVHLSLSMGCPISSNAISPTIFLKFWLSSESQDFCSFARYSDRLYSLPTCLLNFWTFLLRLHYLWIVYIIYSTPTTKQATNKILQPNPGSLYKNVDSQSACAPWDPILFQGSQAQDVIIRCRFISFYLAYITYPAVSKSKTQMA